MDFMPRRAIRPLWRLLLAATSRQDDVSLSCDECFSILEYLAELRLRVPLSSEAFNTLANKHLSVCPDCQEYYRQKLEEFEAFQSNDEEITPD